MEKRKVSGDCITGMTSLWTRCFGVLVLGGKNMSASLTNVSFNNLELPIPFVQCI